jgi:hypothetical protein
MQSLHAQLFGIVMLLFGVLLLGLRHAPEMQRTLRLVSWWTDTYAPAVIVLLFGASMLVYGLLA